MPRSRHLGYFPQLYELLYRCNGDDFLELSENMVEIEERRSLPVEVFGRKRVLASGSEREFIPENGVLLILMKQERLTV